jgi:hypothetical protein
MTVRLEMAEWRATSAKSETRVTCAIRRLKAEGRGSKFRTLQPSVFSLETASPVPLFQPVSPVSLGSEHE